jgi:prefoldin subunit 2
VGAVGLINFVAPLSRPFPYSSAFCCTVTLKVSENPTAARPGSICIQKMAEPELKTEQQVIARFQELRQAVSTIINKIADMETEASEHDLVIKALQPMEKSRRCYRLIGDVLVERNVGEALPAVQKNRDNIGDVLKNLQAQLRTQEEKLQQFQQKYKIRVRGQDEDSSAPSAPQKSEKGASSSSQGVLVT